MLATTKPLFNWHFAASEIKTSVLRLTCKLTMLVVYEPSFIASIQLKGLILAQNERWRRGLGMQVEREVLKRCFG
uniref:Uncharacterized protein n=1 Tax=uncultured planctomycete 6FN TaxID=455068 RepID=A9LGZ6_9BACT|nr:hypothetical protein 6FN_17 [uncultured planctomycete 6FN]